MMTFRQWMMQMARQYGRHYVVALFMAACFSRCCSAGTTSCGIR
ncbi:MAG: hypothetical protein ACLVJ6_07700 [Merdibacter sp.]